jgi:hypothetical protein
MSERIEGYRQKLASARQHLDSVLDAVGDRWDTPVYSEGAAWNVKQLLLHLAISDKGQSSTVKQIAAGQNPIPEDFDVERYNRRSVEKQAEMTIDEARQVLDETRADFMAWLDTLDESALDQQGRHANLNIYTISQFLDVIAQHERNHADDIAQVLGLGG